MTSGIRIGARRVRASTVLLILLGLTFGAALLTPEPDRGGRPFSSYGVGENGTRIMYELAQRMGWQTSRRITLLDSVPGRDVQVVIGPHEALGAGETHRLIENVRRGGGLIFSIDEAPELADSLGMRLRERSRILAADDDSDCRPQRSFRESRIATLPPSGHEIAWKRPAPGPVTDLAMGRSPRTSTEAPLVIGFPVGSGRVAAFSAAELATNGALRVCTWAADIAVARALEYVRPVSSRMVFDEFHHGYGVHGGSLKAVSMFLSRTTTGRFLAQALIAALILLFAAAPRPIVPRDPARVVRRSPLEHADALGHAYADVGATRTATSRLVDGLRRRAGRTVASGRTTNEASFLDAVEARTPSLAPQVALVRRALDSALPPREFPSVGDAVATIERTLLTSPPTRS